MVGPESPVQTETQNERKLALALALAGLFVPLFAVGESSVVLVAGGGVSVAIVAVGGVGVALQGGRRSTRSPSDYCTSPMSAFVKSLLARQSFLRVRTSESFGCGTIESVWKHAEVRPSHNGTKR